MARCEDCRKLISGTPKKSMLGRTQCARCHGVAQATAAGVIAGGGRNSVGNAVATRGWFGRIHDTIRGNDKK